MIYTLKVDKNEEMIQCFEEYTIVLLYRTSITHEQAKPMLPTFDGSFRNRLQSIMQQQFL